MVLGGSDKSDGLASEHSPISQLTDLMASRPDMIVTGVRYIGDDNKEGGS